MILLIGFMLLLVSVEILLLGIDSKLDKIMTKLEIHNKSKETIERENYIEDLKKRII